MNFNYILNNNKKNINSYEIKKSNKKKYCYEFKREEPKVQIACI
jgi:hypothetical protein